MRLKVRDCSWLPRDKKQYPPRNAPVLSVAKANRSPNARVRPVSGSNKQRRRSTTPHRFENREEEAPLPRIHTAAEEQQASRRGQSSASEPQEPTPCEELARSPPYEPAAFGHLATRARKIFGFGSDLRTARCRCTRWSFPRPCSYLRIREGGAAFASTPFPAHARANPDNRLEKMSRQFIQLLNE